MTISKVYPSTAVPNNPEDPGGGGSGSGGSTVSPSSFTYLGHYVIPATLAFTTRALAYSPSRGTWFTIGNSGQTRFPLLEIQFPESFGENAALVRNWGEINTTGNVLQVGAGSVTLMKGLLWDAERDGLWCTYGSYYVNPGAYPHFLVFVTLNDTTSTIERRGPWKAPVDLMPRCQMVTQFAPASLQSVTGRRFIGYGGKSGHSARPWGPGLVSFADPYDLPASSEVPMTTLLNWPRLVGTAGYSYSGFDSDTTYNERHIFGNNNANPPSVPSYEVNTIIDVSSWQQADHNDGMVVIGETLLYWGRRTQGYSWYGNQNSHNDTTPAGVTFNNNLTSLINPPNPCLGIEATRGYHAENYKAKMWFVPLSEAVTAASESRVISPQAVHKPDFYSVGGTITPTHRELGQGVYRADQGRLYILRNGAGASDPTRVHVWSIS
ncbi:MAG: hypothetical protein NNA30_11475 [Nitrospira sp.]|nr:hypothetical protein [Nitrospira sp.]